MMKGGWVVGRVVVVDWSDAEIKELGQAVGHVNSVKYMTVKYNSNVKRRNRGKSLCM